MPPYIPRITTSCPRICARAHTEEIEREMEEPRVEYFKSQNKLIEAQRIEERTRYDLEMLREIGYCSGIENYSRVFAGREPARRRTRFSTTSRTISSPSSTRATSRCRRCAA